MNVPLWHDAAECRNHPAAWWVIETTDDDGRHLRRLTEQNLMAEDLCRDVCPVRAQCLAWKRQRETIDRWTWPLVIIGGVRHDGRGHEVTRTERVADDTVPLAHAAQRAGVAENTMRRDLREGLLPGVQDTRGWWHIAPADLDAYRRYQRREAAAMARRKAA